MDSSFIQINYLVVGTKRTDTSVKPSFFADSIVYGFSVST
jgi:hypothetical protein